MLLQGVARIHFPIVKSAVTRLAKKLGYSLVKSFYCYGFIWKSVNTRKHSSECLVTYRIYQPGDKWLDCKTAQVCSVPHLSCACAYRYEPGFLD